MFRRILSVFGNQVLIYILQIVLSVLSARLLGPTQRGVVVVATLVSTLVASLAQLGLPGALVYNLARVEAGKEAINEAIAVCLRFVPVAIVVILLFYGVSYQLSRDYFLRGLSSGLVLSSLVLSILSLCQLLISNILVGLQNFPRRNMLSLLSPLLVAIALAVGWLLRMPLTPIFFVGLYIVAAAIATLVGAACIVRDYHPTLSLRMPQDWKRNYLSFGLKSYIAMIAQTLNYRLDSLLLNALAGSKAVGLYSVGVGAAELLLFIPNAVAVVVYPKIASVHKEERNKVAVLSLGTSLYLVLGNGIVLGLLLPWLLPLMYGHAFVGAIPAAQWLLPGMLALTIVKTLSSVVAGLGRPEAMTYAILVGLLGTVVLDFLLIPRVGIIGAAWASSIAYWASALAILGLYMRLSKVSPGLVVRDLVIEPVVWLRRRWNQKLAMLRSPAG